MENKQFEAMMDGITDIQKGIEELKKINRQQIEINKEVQGLFEKVCKNAGLTKTDIRLKKANMIMERLLKGAN